MQQTMTYSYDYVEDITDSPSWMVGTLPGDPHIKVCNGRVYAVWSDALVARF
jgi:hypothetical protein